MFDIVHAIGRLGWTLIQAVGVLFLVVFGLGFGEFMVYHTGNSNWLWFYTPHVTAIAGVTLVSVLGDEK